MISVQRYLKKELAKEQLSSEYLYQHFRLIDQLEESRWIKATLKIGFQNDLRQCLVAYYRYIYPYPNSTFRHS